MRALHKRLRTCTRKLARALASNNKRAAKKTLYYILKIHQDIRRKQGLGYDINLEGLIRHYMEQARLITNPMEFEDTEL
jgi:hypothetical protein